MAFRVFLFVNATLFIRPGDLLPALSSLPIYNVLIVTCLLTAGQKILDQLKGESLRRSPISACVLGLFGMLFVSNLVRFDIPTLLATSIDFLKVAIYYFMLLSVVDSAKRVRSFLFWVTIFALVVSGLALLQYHEIIHLETLETLERVDYNDDGEGSVTTQLRGVGIYNDPNDLCLLLVMGFSFALYEAIETRGVRRVLWAGPIGLFLYALVMTRSRGGFLALLVTVAVLFVSRLGIKKALPLIAIALPGMLLLSGGRQTEISVGQGTAQERMEKWKEGLILFGGRPLTGIGVGRYAEEIGLVAHNSYVHAFVEMGFPGGMFFVGLFFFAFEGLRVKYYTNPMEADPAFLRLRPYLTAMLAGYATGIFSLSRNYIVPTYMVFGIVAAYQRLALWPPESGGTFPGKDSYLKLFGVTILVFIAIKVFLAIASH